MRPLFPLALATAVSAGLAVWQQQSIDAVLARSARLSEQLLKTQALLAEDQAALEATRDQLKGIDFEARKLLQERSALSAGEGERMPTPEQEGWWPEMHPYFYLPKHYLAKVQFGGRPITTEGLMAVSTDDPLARGKYMWMSYNPFSDAGLNPHMAMLLGMGDEEVTAVNDLYAEFVRDLRAVESTHIQRVDPPEPAGDDRVVVARMPSLSAEAQPLLARWEAALSRSLGSTRAEILEEHTKRYFDDEMDGLGAEPREFLRRGFNLWVRFTNRWGQHMGGTSYMIYDSQDWQYGHLFGPGAPCELK
jgi:hypothetical protein